MLPLVVRRVWHISRYVCVSFFFRVRLIYSLIRYIKELRSFHSFPSIPLYLCGTYGSGKTTFIQALYGLNSSIQQESLSCKGTIEIQSPMTWSNKLKVALFCDREENSDPVLLVTHRSFPSSHWIHYVRLREEQGFGRKKTEKQPFSWEKESPEQFGVILFLHPNKEESSEEKELCCALVRSFGTRSIPVFVLLNAIDLKQKRYALSLEEELQRTKDRLQKMYGLNISGVDAVSSFYAWVMQHALSYKGALPDDLKEEAESCLTREDESASNPYLSALQKSRLSEAEKSIQKFVEKHFFPDWCFLAILSIKQSFESKGIRLPWLRVGISEPQRPTSSQEPKS